MKHLMLYIAAVSALQLVRLDGESALADDSSKPEKEMALVTQYMKGSVTRRQLTESAYEMTASMKWQDAVQSIKHDLPQNIVSIISTKQDKKKGETPEADLDRAREILNGMIETSQAEYDLKDMECRAFEESNRAEFNQAVADLSRIGKGIATDNANILSAKADISMAEDMDAEQDKQLKAAEDQCASTKLANELQLTTLEADLRTAMFIVSMAECKEGAAFLQQGKAAAIESCPMADGSEHLSFKDGFLANKAAMMHSAQGKQALQVALLNSHGNLDAKTHRQLSDAVTASQKKIAALSMSSHIGQKPGAKGGKGAVVEEEPSALEKAMSATTTVAPVPPKSEPEPEEAANKCVLGKPDCGLLTDNMMLMMGDIKDSVDELTSIMAENEKVCKQGSAEHNQMIATWQGVIEGKNVELVEATGSLNANTEEQSERQGEKELLEKQYEETYEGECAYTLHEILFVNICGVKIVRGEIAKVMMEDYGTYGPTDILDCLVTEWIPEECSIPCIDEVLCGGPVPLGELPDPSCSGGIQNMTRDVVQNLTLGAPCPAMVLEKGCNAHPCPINCDQSLWSEWGKCSKECGGGIEQHSRSTKVKPDNGGESCGPGSEAQSCNEQSCDVNCVLEDWTAWGPCSRGCNAGIQERARLIQADKEGNGLCAEEMSEERFEQQECNVQACPNETLCLAKQDVVLGIDVSGSLKQEGFDTMMLFVQDILSMYQLGVNNSQIGLLEYSKVGRIVSPLESDPEALKTAAAGITFQRGITDMAQGFSLAKTILMEGRKEASSIVILLTDGKPNFRFSTDRAAQELRDAGVRVVMVPIFQYGNADFMAELASDPQEDNVIEIGGLPQLAATTIEEAKRLVTSTCAVLQYPEEPKEELGGKGGKEALSAILNPPKPHKHQVKRVFHKPHHTGHK